jgi:peptidoglycan/LPS O-acetylase OafA/YrhL
MFDRFFSQFRALSSYDAGRDNNFNLLRAIAATMVIYSHTLALSARSETIGGVTSFGTLGVRLFFVMSGFLITKSFLSRHSFKHFLLARFFRIYPGAWVAVLFCLFPVGWYFSNLDGAGYWLHPGFRHYLFKDLTLITGIADPPGVFAQNPIPGAVNGSLFTLQYELILYLMTGLLGVLALLQDKKRYAICLAVAVLAYWFFKTIGAHNLAAFLKGSGLRADRWLDLSLLFILGGAFHIYRKRMPLNWPLAILSIALVFASFRWGARDWILPVFFAYGVLALAFLPGGFMRKFNLLGDYSYGLYIYAFPVQQSLLALYLRAHPGVVVVKGKHPAWEVWPFFFSSLIGTILLAILSWHLVEKPALRVFQRMSRAKPTDEPVERRW